MHHRVDDDHDVVDVDDDHDVVDDDDDDDDVDNDGDDEVYVSTTSFLRHFNKATVRQNLESFL